MKISYRWLGRHVDLSGISPQRVVEDLTLSTCEVESLTPFLPHLANIVVGHVLTRAKHPDADKLSVCSVDCGEGTARQIVCGAPNVDAGQMVAVALPGVELPGDFRIKKSKIRGVESDGMICSERELGLGDEHNGIWVLPETLKPGAKLADAMDLSDWVIEIDNKSLTHRPDLWGHRGFAAEIAAMHLRPLKPLETSLPPTGNGPTVPVRIESQACTRYLALRLEGVQARRSPDWLRALLFAVDQRPIDLLVDLSNFVMLDLGQPNHVFDATRLDASGITVRNARAEERFRTLDGVERRLEPSDLLIASGDKAVALAGIMGGEDSKVEAGTQSLLLEVASFHFATVRRTAARLALRTDSSTRFEKNLDPTLPLRAAGHYVRLLAQLEPGLRLPAPLCDAGEWKDPARVIELSCERVRSLLGVELADVHIADILMRLGFGVKGSSGTLYVSVPSARATKDIGIDSDLIEEVGRIHRYGNIPEARITAPIAPPPRDEGWQRRMLVRTLQDRLAGAARFHETLSYSFVSDAILAELGATEERHVAVINPIAEGFSKIRRHVMPSLLATLAHNRRMAGEVRLFEIGKGYQPEYSSTRGEPREVHELSLVWAGPVPAKGARFDAGRFSQLQGVLEDLVRATGRQSLSWSAPDPASLPSWAHPGRALVGRAGEGDALVTLAALEPRLAARLGLKDELASDVALAELSLDVLLGAEAAGPRYRPLPVFPAVKVDVAVAAPRERSAGELAAVLTRAGKGLVRDLELFDLYEGEKLGAGRRSHAWHVTLVSDERTLGEEDIGKFFQRAEREFTQLGAELRKG